MIAKESTLDIKIIFSSVNLFYWGGANYALNSLGLDFNDYPDWIIICNNDILFNKSDFLSKLLRLKTNDYPILAPAILSSRTSKNLNPFISKPINTFARLYYSIYYINSLTAFAIYNIRKLLKILFSRFYKTINQRSIIYAAHGSFIIFSKHFFKQGGFLDQNLTMHGEEFTTAEIARSIKMPIYYDPGMEVIHVDHSSNSMNWFKSFYSTKKAYYYFLKEYL